MKKMIKVLMIEDDLEIAELLGEYLFRYNIKLTNFETPTEGLKELKSNNYDLAILDLSLPEIDGTNVCKIIRKNSNIPIIISTARGGIDDKIACFEYGADDYLPKPYESQELVLRIKVLLRRNAKEEVQQQTKVFTLSKEKLEIYKKGKLINFTNAEFYIMEYLIKRAGYAVSREELLLNVESIKYESSYKSIDVLISRIRSKIEKNSKKPKYIISLRGVGYKFINQ
jgi:two-component system OmpR family response regulator